MRRTGYTRDRDWGPSGLFASVFDDLFLPPAPVLRDVVRSVEDRRTWHPLGGLRPAGSLHKDAAQIVATDGRAPAAGLRFLRPKLVARCVRRKVRREVLFATRRNGGGHRAPRRDWFSDIGC